jgi:SAM-dependent methyltransferase
MGAEMDLSVIVPATNVAPQELEAFLRDLQPAIRELGVTSEVLLVVNRPGPVMTEMAERQGSLLIEARGTGYGTVVKAGIAAARGAYLLTVDADLLDMPATTLQLWAHRQEAEVTIASRYVAGARSSMPLGRRLLSRVLNVVFSRGLSLRIRDMSSGVRIYRANVVKASSYNARDFDILQEILVRAYMDGWRVREVPFSYRAREHGSTAKRLFGFGFAYARTLGSLWKTRNSILAADYDDRAHDSPIPLQRYWQRQRFHHITDLIEGEGAVLDVGCGSSRIIGALAGGSVGVDILLRKLRYGRKFDLPLVQASGFELPFPDASFPCVLCSQVIEHVPKESPILDELDRCLAPGGRLVLGTPDYANWEWVVTEKLYGWFAPGAYADEHIAHYTREELIEIFVRRGYRLEDTRYILHGELILGFRKHGSRAAVDPMKLVCPSCRGPLIGQDSEDGLDCSACRLRYPIAEGIPVLMTDTAAPL